MNPTDPYGRLIDPVLAEEIELLGEVIGAVASAGHRLDAAEVDRALHVPDACVEVCTERVTDPREGDPLKTDPLKTDPRELDAAG